MIISASRRTDIPAFYSKWFMRRIREGFFYRVNPFNSRQVSGFSLKAEDVDAICFWSKNPGPLLPHLAELDRRGYRYYFQFTLNPYGREFEPNLPPIAERIATLQELAGRIGPERVIWRLDPIIVSNSTPLSWHLEQAEQLAGQLQDSTRRMMFSFLDFYGKVAGRLKKLQQQTGIVVTDITRPEQKEKLEQLARGLKEIADRHKMTILSCAEELDLSAIGIDHGSCIDGRLINELFGIQRTFPKDKNQRSACCCVESIDMGMYDTCLFKCVYCYANRHESMIESNRCRHDPDSPSLLNRYDQQIEIRSDLHQKKTGGGQMELI